jgi:nitroimidazol reductase NimA-like FMN-containing flavoprotein (pyridoxamine 5'-phosphate oxidase superfamily)
MFWMEEDQMKDLLERCAWGTLATIDMEGNPYAIEFTYFMMEGRICAMINPNGTTAKNLLKNPNSIFKVCLSDPLCRKFEAVSIYGKGKFEQDKEKVGKGWDMLEERLHYKHGAYGKAKEKFTMPDSPSTLFVMTIEKMTGVANHKGMVVEMN